MEATKDMAGKVITEQMIPTGPAASQIAIKQLGTNGDGDHRRIKRFRQHHARFVYSHRQAGSPVAHAVGGDHFRRRGFGSLRHG